MNRAPATLFVCVLSAAAGLLASAAILTAGPLSPPAGPVAATHRTLAEIEPRIAINTANTPGDAGSVFKITKAGSYYLTGNLAGVSGKHGIEIAADDVSIDLNGFCVAGVAGSFDGITVNASRTGLTVRRGTVASWGGSGVALSFQNTGGAFLVESIIARGNGADGINVARGGVVRGCIVELNGGDGIDAAASATIEDCAARANAVNGLRLGSSSRASRVTAFSNSTRGVQLATDSTLTSSVSYANFGVGVAASLRCLVADCAVSANNGDAIQVTSACTVRGNACSLSGFGAGIGAGVHTTDGDNTIDGNNCTLGDRGLHVEGTGNIVISNTCSGNTTANFTIAASNAVGPVLDRTNPGGLGVSGNSATSTLGTTAPFANFAY